MRSSSAPGERLGRLVEALASWFGGSEKKTAAEAFDVRGFTVVVENSRPDIATNDVLDRLDEAIALIEEHQPWRVRHLQRDLKQFLVTRFPCRGAYIPGDRTCITELTFLARRDITAATVASSIVHEGIHARADQMGVRRETRDRAKEERLCRRAEVEFGQSLPPELGHPVIERALGTLTLADDEVAPNIDWAEANALQEEIDRKARL